MKLRSIAAVWAAKITAKVCVHIFHRQGATWAGRIALLISPTVLSELSEQVRRGSFAVCGTNGKTTVNNLLCKALEAEGSSVICNYTGSNMLNGVAAAFVLGAKTNGRLDADYACIEIDEAAAREVFTHFKPNQMVLTNLFRDQLDRYGEIDTTMDILNKAIRFVPPMKLIVNGDDPLSTYLALMSGSDYVTYGISEPVHTGRNTQEIREGRFCRYCGTQLAYRFYHYGQLGDYHCPGCGFKRPELEFAGRNVELYDGLSFTVGGKWFRSSQRGFYNVYNILAAYAAVRTAGLKAGNFRKVLSDFHPKNGRMEEFFAGDTRILLNLAKNPTGFNQNIDVVLQDEQYKELIIAVNDNEQDGTDISWLWDVDFERLGEIEGGSVTVSGIRCRDLMLRLKYAGIHAELEQDVEKALHRHIAEGSKNLYVLVNYTALFDTRNLLKRICEEEHK